MFYKCEDSDIEIYADEAIPYACASDINTVNSLHDLTTITWKLTLKKATFFWAPKLRKKNLFWWSLGRIKFNWKIAWNSDWFWPYFWRAYFFYM